MSWFYGNKFGESNPEHHIPRIRDISVPKGNSQDENVNSVSSYLETALASYSHKEDENDIQKEFL